MHTLARIGLVGSAVAGAVAWIATAAGNVAADSSGASPTTLTIYDVAPSHPGTASGDPAYSYGGAGYGGAGAANALPAASGFAIVRQRRTIELGRGDTEVRWDGVAGGIDPASVQFESLTDPAGTRVIEQRFRHDVATPDALLARAVGSMVTIDTAGGAVQGTLRAFDGERLVVEAGDGAVHVIRRGDAVHDIRLGPVTGGVAASPTLVWKVRAARAGSHDVRVGYQTAGITWRADYAVVWDERASRADLTAWVTVANDSGVDFDRARVRLVTAPPATSVAAMPAAAVTRSWLESDVLVVADDVSVPTGASRQVSLFPPVAGVRARRVLVHDSIPGYTYYPTGYPNMDMYAFNYQARAKTADVYLEVDGRKRPALPAGTARLYRRATGGEAELVAQAPVDHSAAGAPLRVRVGAHPSLEVAHSQLEFRLDERAKQMRERVEVKLTNRGKAAVEVVVREVMWRWTDWAIETESPRGVRVGPLTQEYRVAVPAGASRKVTYTVAYSW